jgi:hypothetical protein
MSAFNMKPKFTNEAGYKDFRASWTTLYGEVSGRIRKLKMEAKQAHRTARTESERDQAARLQSQLVQERAMGAKAMSLLEDAKVRWQQIRDIQQNIAEQHATFPITIENVRNMDFHFNKKHLEFPDIVPMWTLKAKGQSFYLNHIDCQTPWSTRETPDSPSTKGSIRIKRGTIHIDEQANATIS